MIKFKNQINIFFRNQKERKTYHVFLNRVIRNKIKIKYAYKSTIRSIPGFWLSIETSSRNLYNKLLLTVNDTIPNERIDNNVFYPRKYTSFRDLEINWKKKYSIDYLSPCENLLVFYKEIKKHLKYNRIDIAYAGLNVILKYNPLFLSKYNRYFLYDKIAMEFQSNNNIKKAEKALKKQLILNKSLENYLGLISFYIENKLYKEALLIINSAMKVYSNEPYLISFYAILNLKLGQYNKALNYIKDIIKSGNNNYIVYKTLGDLLISTEDYKGAIDNYKLALKYFDEDYIDIKESIYSDIAFAYSENEDYQNALNYYELINKISPDEEYVLYNIVYICLYEDIDYNKAYKYSKILINRKPEDAYQHYQMGKIMKGLEKYAKAKWHFYKAKQLSPSIENIDNEINSINELLKN